MLVATGLLETVQFSSQLSERLRRIRRGDGRMARRDARVELALIYERQLRLLRPRVNALWRDIPRLIEQLGGDPSKELLPHRKPRPRLAERGQGSG
jgi:hypothetical protein